MNNGHSTRDQLAQDLLRVAKIAFTVSKEATDPAFKNLSPLNKDYVVEQSDVTEFIPSQTDDYIPRGVSILQSLFKK